MPVTVLHAKKTPTSMQAAPTGSTHSTGLPAKALEQRRQHWHALVQLEGHLHAKVNRNVDIEDPGLYSKTIACILKGTGRLPSNRAGIQGTQR